MKNDYNVKEYSFEIEFKEPRIDDKKLEKIQEAWSNEGYRIFKRTTGWDFEDMGIEIFSSRKAKNGIDAIDITREWPAIKKGLEEEEIPDAWVLEAIKDIKSIERWN